MLLSQDTIGNVEDLPTINAGGNGLYVSFDGNNFMITMNVIFDGDTGYILPDASGKTLQELTIEGIKKWEGVYHIKEMMYMLLLL